MYTAIGYFPAPFLYGSIQQATGGKLSKQGMVFNLALSVPAALMQALALCYKPDLKEYWAERRKDLVR